MDVRRGYRSSMPNDTVLLDSFALETLCDLEHKSSMEKKIDQSTFFRYFVALPIFQQPLNHLLRKRSGYKHDEYVASLGKEEEEESKEDEEEGGNA